MLRAARIAKRTKLNRMARYLFVHAHPDDESLWTGVAMAHHVNAGDEVHVLTCTLGEEGEVIPDDLKHLELPAGQPRGVNIHDGLAIERRQELRRAMDAMGVKSSVVLGDDDFQAVAGSQHYQTYRDSGMVGTPSAAHPRAFAGADLHAVGTQLAAYIAALEPDVVVTYDEQGGYGHPDHIRTHDGVVSALAQLAQAEASVPQLYITLTPHSWAVEDREWLHAMCSAEFLHETGFHVLAADDEFPPSVVVDDAVTHAVIDERAVTRQIAALRAHRTQATVADEVYALSNDIAARLSGREGYARYDATKKQVLPGRSVVTALAAGESAPGLEVR